VLWPVCTAHGDPWVDKGWVWWWRHYLWLPVGFYCPEHSALIEEGHKIDAFKDWPLDTTPEVLATQQLLEEFVPLENAEGQAILRASGRQKRKP
jgi:hypothetical protein